MPDDSLKPILSNDTLLYESVTEEQYSTISKYSRIDNREVTSSVLDIDISKIQFPKYQPRNYFDEKKLEELKRSIDTYGILQPIIVRAIGQNLYEIVAGERRFRAAKTLNLTSIPAIVKKINDSIATTFAIVENVQRDDLSPLEEGEAYQYLIQEYGMTHQRIAGLVGKERSTISNLIRLTKLSDAAKIALNEEKIEMGHARALIALNFDLQDVALNEIIEDNLNVRQAENRVRQILNPSSDKEVGGSINKLYFDHYNDILQNCSSLYSDIRLEFSKKKSGLGKVTLNFDSIEMLEDIIKVLNIPTSKE